MTTRKLIGLAVTMMLLTTALPAAANHRGYLTPQDPYITLADGLPRGSSVKAIINSGDEVGDVVFAGLPDGVGIMPGDRRGTADVFVAHEETTVPFFGTADFQDSSVTRLTLNTRTGAVLDTEVALSAEEGLLRFCSAFMAGPEQGFEEYTFFVNEETNDIVEVPDDAIYPADPAFAPENLRQGGYAVALRAESGDVKVIPGLGRYNHENTVPIPAWKNRTVILSTDDTFDGPSAQLYMYLADDDEDVWDDEGTLWAFQVTGVDGTPVDPDDPFNGANDYLDLEVGQQMQGRFIRVPDDIADGTTDIAPQQALEDWSNANNVFQFIRLEDLAYDRKDPSIVYIADTGRSRVVPDPSTGRAVRGPGGTVGEADNGSVFVMEFNHRNPREVDAFYVLAQGDNPDGDAYVPFVSPDNMDTSRNSLMVQEDTANASIWRMDMHTKDWAVVATVNDPDGESSGITWAKSTFGPGHWLLTVQAHGSTVAEEILPDGTLAKREAGQLLVMKIPGS